jgi:cytochrome c oxidase subunit 2
LRALIAAIACCVAPLGAALGQQPDLESGQRIYAVCAGCHGFGGEGNALVFAPQLAGLESWYVTRQMQNFARGIRGGGETDTHGSRMAQAAAAVRGERALDDVVAYLATLPLVASPATVEGDAEAGRGRYATCAACHGVAGEGNAGLSAPALAGLDDWYFVEQLALFANGARGAHAEDVYGQQMRALAGLFPDDTARRDLAAYVKTLER